MEPGDLSGASFESVRRGIPPTACVTACLEGKQ
jgi:hypothetical protein